MYHENIGLEIFSSTYVLYYRIRCFTQVEELPAITKWKSFLYRSIQFYIATANQEVSKLLPADVTEHPTQSVSSATPRGTYTILTPKQRVTIGNYAILHGTSAALQHSKK